MKRLKTDIYDYVKKYGNVSFAELSGHIKGFKQDDKDIKENGLIAFTLDNMHERNLFLWWGISEEAMDAIDELRLEKKLFIKPTTELVYLADGLIPSAPVAKGLRYYKKPRWVPVVFNIEP